jgi:hypothetical protein
MLKNASEVTLVPNIIFYLKNFELCAKFCGVQSKPGLWYVTHRDDYKIEPFD